MKPATLLEFARASDLAAATTKKLIKQRVLAEYLRGLDDQDLRLAVRYAGGRAFAATDERVLGVSGATVSEVVLAVWKIDPARYQAQVIRCGEIGEALSAILQEDLQHGGEALAGAGGGPLRLRDLAEAFEELARTASYQRKREILGELLARIREPREAAYLAKIIFSDLRTGAREGVLQTAVAEAFGVTAEEVRRGQLLVGDLGEVAALARHGELAAARFRLFHPVQFMLATPQDTAAEAAATMGGRAFYVEDKLDGIRAQVHKSRDRVAIYTRTMDRADESFPDIVERVRQVPGEFLLDGEIVPWRDGSVLPFAHIQRRLGRKDLSAGMIRRNPAAFVAFDVLYRDGELLMDRPLRQRRAILEAMGHDGRLIISAAGQAGSAEQVHEAFCAARARRNEGLVLKDPDSPYAPGRRGQAWLKLKTHLPTIDCVVTAAEYGHGKRRGVLSDYTFAVWDRDPAEPGATLVNIGKAYSGVTDAQIAELTNTFLAQSRGQRGHVHLVEPEIVLEIACDQIQKSARHASGYALRFPRIKRIRHDKRPEDADRLQRIAELYRSAENTACGTEAAGGMPADPQWSLF